MTTEQMKQLYENGLWSKTWLIRAVEKGKITEQQYAEITSLSYSTSSN